MLMYEEAYGYTFTKVLVQTFMIFLTIMMMYTLIKVWLEKLSLFHFYFITSIIYYTSINLVNINQIVVNKNIDRYEQTGKIDVHYLNHTSLTGVLGLIELYKKKSPILKLERFSGPSNESLLQKYNTGNPSTLQKAIHLMK